ncbi:hypothetical protein [Hymenobacter persicinus]|uniref:T9SS type A sorting domain-containing protein n=1 Tax=Hymenobacter persicinus TaxID=2025506 RepID=A0A4Q5LBL0_9BACT|nr:hypothetical protein [Hymenobacter persicinus]RYU79893.1 hypothetical protein EWM57_09415 [Hymenobacter persicinus]
MNNSTRIHLLPRLALLGLLGFASVAAQAQTAPTWASVQRISGDSPSSGSGTYKVAVAPDGSQYVTGHFEGGITFGSISLTEGGGSGHIYLAKYSAAGAVLWATKIDASSSDLFSNVAVDAAGNAYLAGYFAGSLQVGTTALTSSGNDAYVAKYNAQGVVQWVRQGGTAGTFVQGVAVDASGNVTLAGDCVSAVSFGGPGLAGNGPFLVKLSSTGTAQAPKRIGSRGFVNEMTLDGAGNAYVVGTFSGTAQFGATSLTSAGTLDLFLAKLDPAGNVLWTQRDGGANEDNALDVAVDGNGNPMVAGYYDGQGTTSFTSKIYVARFSNQGTRLWSRQLGATTPDEDVANSVTYDGRGGYYITGSFASPIVFGTTTLTTQSQDVYVVRYDSQGNVLWAGQSTSSGGNAAGGLGLAADGAGNVYVGGGMFGTVTFGTQVSAGTTSSSFLAKLTPGGIVAATRPALARVNLAAFPNPAAGLTTLNLPAGGGHLAVVDALGRTVREQALPTAAGACPVSVAGLTPGLYQLRATFANGTVGTAALTVR